MQLTSPTFHFGQLVKTVNGFAYPRTGGHFFAYCLTGLFDYISLPHPYMHNQEAVDRQTELNPEVLYALQLRESAAPFRPVYFEWLSNGVHGVAKESDLATMVLIRDPVATVYSRYRTQREGWHNLTELSVDWLRAELLHYASFYDEALAVLSRQQDRGLLVRFEDLVAGPQSLDRVTSFLGISPKLEPSFVWRLMRFDNVVKPGARTFYLAGDNAAWATDEGWIAALSTMQDLSFERFGYGSVASYLGSVGHR
jgi:hypothetical protein